MTTISFAPHVATAMKLAVTYVPVKYMEYAIMGVMGVGALPKFTGALNKEFPMLPNWFWFPCGLFEVTSITLLLFAAQFSAHLGMPTEKIASIGLYMNYAYLGGTLCSTTVLKFLPPGAIFSCLCAVFCSVIADTRHKIATTDVHMACMAGGFVAGIFFGVVLAKPKVDKKKSG